MAVLILQRVVHSRRRVSPAQVSALKSPVAWREPDTKTENRALMPNMAAVDVHTGSTYG